MECNRDEAVRARDIAETKMQIKDFAAAQKLALTAQRLQGNLDNISQMLIVCEVHCAAEKTLFGTEMDWYGILQVQPTTDEVTIKKQYKRLALQLHPDKNKLPGAEAAFKLIGQAQTLLLDKQKRAQHDMKRKSFVHNMKQSFHCPFRGVYNAKGSSMVNDYRSNYTKVKLNERGAGSSADGRLTFWTMCPFCVVKQEYFMQFINKNVCCQACRKPFMAFETFPPTDMNGGKFPQNCKVSASRNCTTEAGYQQTSKSKTDRRADKIYVKRRRETEFVEDRRYENDKKLKTKNDGDHMVNGNVECRDRPWKSARSEQQVSYRDSQSDVETADSGSTNEESCGDDEAVEQQSAEISQDVDNGVSDHVEENDKRSKREASKAGHDSPSVLKISTPNFYSVPEPEFHDFDISRKESCFARGQIWSLYDTLDAMPRLYAKIIDVLSPGFKLRIRWLEPLDDDDGDSRVSCGAFRLGDAEVSQDIKSFASLMNWKRGSSRNTFKIFPRKKEVWAICKNQELKAKQPVGDSKQQIDYEFVEVLSDYNVKNGISVSFLTKVKGFVSLFSQASKVKKKVRFSHKEVRRFSHKVPSFLMTGDGKAGIHEGCFELDPCSIPVKTTRISSL